MPAPLLTAFAFTYSDKKGRPLFRTTVETPTKLGAAHAERCARCDLQRRPALAARWDGQPGAPEGAKSARIHRQEQRAEHSRIVRETRASGSRHPKAGTVNGVPVEA